MDISFVEQEDLYVFLVNREYYRVSFSRKETESNWLVRLIRSNETVYSKDLDSMVTPDLELAETIARNYITRD